MYKHFFKRFLIFAFRWLHLWFTVQGSWLFNDNYNDNDEGFGAYINTYGREGRDCAVFLKRAN